LRVIDRFGRDAVEAATTAVAAVVWSQGGRGKARGAAIGARTSGNRARGSGGDARKDPTMITMGLLKSSVSEIDSGNGSRCGRRMGNAFCERPRAWTKVG